MELKPEDRISRIKKLLLTRYKPTYIHLEDDTERRTVDLKGEFDPQSFLKLEIVSDEFSMVKANDRISWIKSLLLPEFKSGLQDIVINAHDVAEWEKIKHKKAKKTPFVREELLPKSKIH